MMTITLIWIDDPLTVVRSLSSMIGRHWIWQPIHRRFCRIDESMVGHGLAADSPQIEPNRDSAIFDILTTEVKAFS